MSELPLNQILCGNCIEVLKDFPDNSIDLVVTDPPYGLSFMGKDWDKTLPPKEAFAEIIRVLKPGALAFVMSSPRQDVLWRMLAMLEGVGFELNQSYLEWIYKTGFPKAYDVSKGIDKKIRGNLLREKIKLLMEKRNYDINDLSKLTNIPSKNIWDWVVDGHSPTDEYWSKIKDCINVTTEEEKAFDRIVICKLAKLDSFKGGYGVGYTNYQKIELDITDPINTLSKKWDGWKSQTGLKPAHEPVLMVNKPFSESTIVDNVLEWGTGAINVDVCRIPFQSKDEKWAYPDGAGGLYSKKYQEENRIAEDWHNFSTHEDNKPVFANQKGRFPANLLVSDKALDTGETTKSSKRRTPLPTKGDSMFGIGTGNYAHQTEYDDEGSPFRFFDLDAWAKHHGFLDVPKPDNKERDFGLKGRKDIPKSKFNLNDGSKDERFDGEIPNPRRNIHPTVKPIKLMAYLIELGCPPDGVVLDPFVGSGTTCIAAKQLVRKYVGIEINPEYARMAQARIKAHPVPLSWFDEDVAVPPKVVNEE